MPIEAPTGCDRARHRGARALGQVVRRLASVAADVENALTPYSLHGALVAAGEPVLRVDAAVAVDRAPVDARHHVGGHLEQRAHRLGASRLGSDHRQREEEEAKRDAPLRAAGCRPGARSDRADHRPPDLAPR